MAYGASLRTSLHTVVAPQYDRFQVRRSGETTTYRQGWRKGGREEGTATIAPPTPNNDDATAITAAALATRRAGMLTTTTTTTTTNNHHLTPHLPTRTPPLHATTDP